MWFLRWYSGFVGWSSLVRLRHVTSGLYLAVIGDENGKIYKMQYSYIEIYLRSKSNMYIEEECQCYRSNIRNENVESMCIE